MNQKSGGIFVFVLISQRNGRYFFGQTTDLHRTVTMYNHCSSPLKAFAPLEMFAHKKMEKRTDALKLEQELRKRKNEDEILWFLLYNDFVIHDNRK